MREGRFQSIFDPSNRSFLVVRVPSMVADLVDSSLAGHPLEGLLFGGSPTPDSLVGRARKAFPKATMYVIPCTISFDFYSFPIFVGHRDTVLQRQIRSLFQ